MKRTLEGTYVTDANPSTLKRIWTNSVFGLTIGKLTDGDRFAKALEAIFGKRLTYAELTGKVGEVVPPAQA